MRLIVNIAVSLIAIGGLILPTSANDTMPTVKWLEIAWQPAWINEGTLKGQGHAQVATKMIRAKLPAYRHEDQQTNIVRIYSNLRSGEACFPASSYKGSDISSERRTGLIWSAPTFVLLYHGLIVRLQAVDQINRHSHKGYVSLKSLLADKALVGAYQPGRAYSKYLDEVFTQDPNAKNLFRWAGSNQTSDGIFRMLDANRIDYFIDYYPALKFHEQINGHTGQHRYMQIEEHRGRFGLGAIVCNDTPQGRALISQINALLKGLRKDPAYIKAHMIWMALPGQETLYKHLWETEVLPRLN